MISIEIDLIYYELVIELYVYVYSRLGNSDFPHLVCYTFPRKRDSNTFEVHLLYMSNLITYNLIIDIVYVLITNVSFVPDDCSHYSINK